MAVLTSVEINRLIRRPDFFRNVFLKSTSILTATVLQMLVGMRLDIWYNRFIWIQYKNVKTRVPQFWHLCQNSITPCKFMCLLQEEQVPQLRGGGGGREPRVPGDWRGLRDGGDREEDVLPVQEEAQILAVRVQGRQVGGQIKTYISPATERTVSIYLICILGDRNGKNVSNLYNEWTFHGGDEFSHHRHGERRIRWGQGFIYFIFLWLDIFIKRPFVTMPPLWILLRVAAEMAVKCIFLIGLIVSHGVKICRGGLQSPSLIAPDKMETILLWKWKVSIRCLHNLDDFINQPCHDSLWLFRYNVQ